MAQTNFPSISANSKVYTVIVNPSTTDICLLDASKNSFILQNAGECPIYIKYGTDCNPVIYSLKLNAGSLLADDFGGVITGCVDPLNSGLLLVTLKI